MPLPSRRLRGAQLRLALLPLACVLDLPDACANDLDERDASTASPVPARGAAVEFDAAMLTQRGIDPKLAEYFRDGARFAMGAQDVGLRVNGKNMGRIRARFDERGSLCVDAELLDAAEVARPRSGPLVDRPAPSSCIALVSIFPTASVELDPSGGKVSILVPTDALITPGQDVSGYARGGRAALLNYEIMGLDSRWDTRRSHYWSANTEAGFNVGDWVVRSRQVSTNSDGRHRTEVLDTYAQRSFAEQRAVLQLGELSTMNPTLSGAQITGVQLMSEQALGREGAGATIDGVAPTQARIEIRQGGVLVYSTVVPAGPFALTNVPRINRHANLDVTVIGTGGQTQRFTVAPSMASPFGASAGYTLAAGRVRNAVGVDAPWVVSAGWSGTVRRQLSLSSGLVTAPGYHAVGVGLGRQLGSATQVQFDVSGSRTTRHRASGMQGTMTLSQRLGEQWMFALADTRQSPGFRELLDTTRYDVANVRRTRYRGQSSASLSWSDPRLGSVSGGYSRTVLFNGRSARRAQASWATHFARMSVSLSAEWNLGTPRGVGNNSIYFTMTVPLGENSRLASTVRRHGREVRYGANVSEQVNELVSYRAGVEYRPGDHRRSLSTGVSLLPRYLQLDAGYARDMRSSNTSLGLRGGFVLHEQGLTASPYAVRDTFGVILVGDTAGVRVSTPGGPVWTDSRGYAVLPQIAAYGKSSVEVATDSLPRHVDIQNGAAIVTAARGAVTRLDFKLKKTRRVLVRVRTVDGDTLPSGAMVTDEADEMVGLVQGDGEIFVPNALETPRLRVSGPDMSGCAFTLDLGEPPRDPTYYESATAVCGPDGDER